MTKRHLTITMQSDWKSALRAAGIAAKAKTYQGEVLNFESPGQFFGQLTEKRWEIVRAAQGQGQKAEEAEVAGRHKNSGQKGHKGAREPCKSC
jgi:predicted transcriptional regulator